MILVPFIYLAVIVLQGVWYILNKITFALPNGILSAVDTATGYLHYLDGLFPVSDLLGALTFLIGIYIASLLWSIFVPNTFHPKSRHAYKNKK